MWDTFVKVSSIFQIPVVIVPSLGYVNNRLKLTEQTISQFVGQFQKFFCEPPHWLTNTLSLLQDIKKIGNFSLLAQLLANLAKQHCDASNNYTYNQVLPKYLPGW